MTFEEVWNSIDLETVVTVSNGFPPPSSNTEGLPYKEWFSHNFTGTLEEKIDRNGWKYLRFEVDPTTTPVAVEYLAYEVAQGPGHSFEVV
jgi:hypothetical protein